MPIYEYQCRSCKHQLESIQKISDEPLVDCPACGESALKKLMSAPAFRLKGGGWYETDFKTGNKKNLAGDGAGSSGAEKGSPKSGGETKSKSSTDKPSAKNSSAGGTSTSS